MDDRCLKNTMVDDRKWLWAGVIKRLRRERRKRDWLGCIFSI